MKNIIPMAALAAAVGLALASTGCVSSAQMGHEYASFISQIPTAQGAEVTSGLVTPFSDMSETAIAFSTDAEKGTFNITKGALDWKFPLIGVHKYFNVGSLTLAATPEQLAQAKAVRSNAPPATGGAASQ